MIKSSILRGIASVLFLVILWEVSVRFGWIGKDFDFPSFSALIIEIINMLLSGDPTLKESYCSSLIRVLIGFIVGSTSGIALGICMGWNEKIDDWFRPIVSLLYPIPALGWVPLLMLLIGINEVLPIVIIFICSFFPIVYNTVTGIKAVKPEFIHAARLLGANDITILRRIVIPQALPYIFTGLKLESGHAWRTVVAAEMIAIPSGLGALMMKGESLMRIDIILVSLFVISMMCLLFESFFTYLEKKMTFEWSENGTH